MRNFHASALNVALALSDDTTIDENGEERGGASTENLQTHLCELLGTHYNETLFGRSFLEGEISCRHASIANYGNSLMVSSSDSSSILPKSKLAEDEVILNYPQDDL